MTASASMLQLRPLTATFDDRHETTDDTNNSKITILLPKEIHPAPLYIISLLRSFPILNPSQMKQLIRRATKPMLVAFIKLIRLYADGDTPRKNGSSKLMASNVNKATLPLRRLIRKRGSPTGQLKRGLSAKTSLLRLVAAEFVDTVTVPGGNIFDSANPAARPFVEIPELMALEMLTKRSKRKRQTPKAKKPKNEKVLIAENIEINVGEAVITV